MRKSHTIMHLNRGDRSPAWLYSWGGISDFMNALGKKQILGIYGGNPEPESLEALRGELELRAAEGTRKEIDDRGFSLRLLLSALAFLASYFILSYVIRDPIPLLDEFVGSLGLGALIYSWLLKRGRHAPWALERRTAAMRQVRAIRFEHSALLMEAEFLLEEADKIPLGILVRRLLDPGITKETDYIDELLCGLIREIGFRKIRTLERRLKKEKNPATLVTLLDCEEDLPLFYLYRKVWNTVIPKVTDRWRS